jgi:hypothetical protein
MLPHRASQAAVERRQWLFLRGRRKKSILGITSAVYEQPAAIAHLERRQ